jgi:hypothetical protein
MPGILVKGTISCDEIAAALKKAFPGRSIHVGPNAHDESDSQIIEILSCPDDNSPELFKIYHEKEKEFQLAEKASQKALLTIQTLHKQQQDLFGEFVLLRKRYDEQKAATINILWNQCAKYHPDLGQVPSIEDASTFEETDDRIGNLIVGDYLGEGQFATVKCCAYEGSTHQYALKMIKKERITNFTSLMRVSNEIGNLRMLKSPFIVAVEQVIHTQDMLYIVTEKGGRDLFEFFDEHPNGVNESWARDIISCVLKGVLYCHDQGICHRGNNVSTSLDDMVVI